MPTLLVPLRHRDFRLLMAAFTLSDIGGWAYTVALGVWVHDVTGSLGWVAAATACRFLPALLLSPYAGVVADRVEKVRLMVGLDLALAVLVAGNAALLALGAPVAVVVAVAGLTSVVGTAYEPAAVGLTPLVVGESDLAAANALRSVVDNVTVVLGPALAGLLLAVAGPPEAVAVNAASFLLSAAAMGAVRIRSGAEDVTEGGTVGVLGQLGAGVRAIVSSTPVTVLVGCSVLATVGYGLDSVLLVGAADELLGTGAEGVGLLFAGLGLGGVLGAALVPWAERRARLAPVIVVGLVAYFLPLVVLVLLAEPAAAVAAMVVRGAGTVVVDVLALTALQRSLPQQVLARVSGAFESLLLGAVLVGSLAAPLLVAGLGLEGALWVAGLGTSVACLLAWPLLRLADADADAPADDRVEALAACDLFEALPAGALEQLARGALRMSLEPGQLVVRQGDRADALYVVLAGRLSVGVDDATGTRTMPMLGEGDHFGEIGLLHHRPRTATVATATTTVLLRIDGPAFRDALTRTAPSPALLSRAALRLARSTHGPLLDPLRETA
ncbi:MFS transporter [Nocardioides sp. SOB77]|uniref:MFS transporter n=1 Tax=Nocardioides oceani TaxID=3058369 RepID=A0ABT8FL36_9ACTN|nr:MFS transporter [Nocardioides oceani]MDN4175384.1 MFS transporter [Nocardioides oceani]